jgi:hypothetical protein
VRFQAGLVARLTWWELSWDIMEPVTYMLTFTTGIGGKDPPFILFYF